MLLSGALFVVSCLFIPSMTDSLSFRNDHLYTLPCVLLKKTNSYQLNFPQISSPQNSRRHGDDVLRKPGFYVEDFYCLRRILHLSRVFMHSPFKTNVTPFWTCTQTELAVHNGSIWQGGSFSICWYNKKSKEHFLVQLIQGDQLRSCLTLKPQVWLEIY